MSAPTVWEEGRLPGALVALAAAISTAIVVAADLTFTSRLSLLTTVGFVLVCVGAALAVRPGDFSWVCLLLPALAALTAGTLAGLRPDWVARPGDGWVQATISGLTELATALFLGYLLALGVLLVRQRVLAKGHRSGPESVGDRT